jgi:glycosyltransferase involved in cell wall biosynthesis
MTTVSIAMCTFNGEAFLIQQLNSLAAQMVLTP